jgi:hypothetical protein
VVAIVRDHHVLQDQAAEDMIAAVTAVASHLVNPITAATAAADRTHAPATAPAIKNVLATTTMSAAISPATSHPASLAASGRMMGQGIDS